MTAKEDGPTLAGSLKLDVVGMDCDQELWQMSPDAPITLPKGGVDVWLIHLERSNAVIAALETLLNDSERRRAYRYFTEVLEEHYIVRRGRLRRILSYYLGKTPASIQFRVDSHGKLSVHEVISFNISDSGDYALCGIWDGNNIGVDIEQNIPIADLSLIASCHFSPGEQSDLYSLPERDRMHAFYSCWTRKEAIIKADGRGLSIPLNSFDVTLLPREEPVVRRYDPSVHFKQHWWLRNIPLGSAYTGALAVDAPIQVVRYWIDAEYKQRAIRALNG
jgi:4'-phosphopantetheinyl transferase